MRINTILFLVTFMVLIAVSVFAGEFSSCEQPNHFFDEYGLGFCSVDPFISQNAANVCRFYGQQSYPLTQQGKLN